MCVFTNLISTSIHGTRTKRKKNRQRQEIKYLESLPGGKRKKYRSKRKKKPTSSDPFKKNQGIRSQLVNRKLKTFRESCNATITKGLNTSGANYKISLNRELEIF